MRISPRFLHNLCTAPLFWSGLAVSLVLHLLVMQMVESKGRVQFESAAESARLAIENRMRSYQDVLHGAHALFSSSDAVSRVQFHRYVKELDLARSFPGISNLNFAPRVFAQEKTAFETAVRQDASLNGSGYPDFRIEPAPPRPEYHVVSYLEPLATASAALGHDLAAEPASQQMLDLLRDSGQPTASAQLLHAGGADPYPALEMRMPLYRHGMPTGTAAERRAAYYGSVGARFDVRKLMLGAIDSNTVPHLQIRLYDTGPVGQQSMAGTHDPQRLLFDSDAGSQQAGPGTADRPGLFVKRSAMTVGQRAWEAEFSMPKSALLNGFDTYLPWAVLLVGLIASVLLCGLSYSLATARRRALEMASDMTRDLRASEASLEEAQHMARLGSWSLEPVSGNMSWSTETYRILGFRSFPDQPQYGDFLRRVYKGDLQQVRDGLEQAIRSGDEFRTEHRITHEDGTLYWVQIIARVGHDGQGRLLRGTIMDISERKSAVDELTRSQELLRELTAYQDRIREEERKRIAREIHDELGQTLLALRIDVSMLDARTSRAHPRLNGKVRLALQHLDATVKTVRGIINNLRPTTLDLGLNAAIEWQVAEFRRRTGIACELLMGEKEIAVDEARATSLFRILQESLTNVIRHAKASLVIVELQQEREQLVMRIADNGIGIQPGPHAGNSFGLVGMEERVLALGGEFDITGVPGKGTTITVHIPLHAPSQPSAAGADAAPSAPPRPAEHCL